MLATPPTVLATPPTVLAQEGASKVCNRKRCTRTHTTTFKRCPACREINKKSMRKRKRKTAEADKKVPVTKGHKRCTQCKHIQPKDLFKPMHARRKKLTKVCLTCRKIARRTEINPTTTTGKCLKVWRKWKDEHVCAQCRDARHTEADHNGDKVHRCSDYSWWACHGGVEALELELAKCQPLCRFCHRLKSDKERGTQTHPSILRKQKIINAEKLRVGVCQECGRRCIAENSVAFDWAHTDRETKIIAISHLVYKSKAYFDDHWQEERDKCRLLCCMCHADETLSENARSKLEMSEKSSR